jgi:hypothetical protein
MAGTKNEMLLAGVGADELSHILHNANDGYVDQLRHVNSLAYNFGCQALGGCDHHDSVDWKRLLLLPLFSRQTVPFVLHQSWRSDEQIPKYARAQSAGQHSNLFSGK